jgi:hypothetical protein
LRPIQAVAFGNSHELGSKGVQCPQGFIALHSRLLGVLGGAHRIDRKPLKKVGQRRDRPRGRSGRWLSRRLTRRRLLGRLVCHGVPPLVPELNLGGTTQSEQ